MQKLTSKWLAIVGAVALSFAIAACGDASSGDADSGEMRAEASGGNEAEGAGEHAAEGGEEARSEGAGGHDGSEGEGSEDEGEHGDSEGEAGGSEGEGERSEGEGSEGEGEHGEEGGHGEGEEGEESGVYIGSNETWDAVRRGAKLVLTFNADTNAFEGTVENTTEQTLCAVRVEVHLDSGTELGPTPRTDVPAGGTTNVTLSTEGAGFETWTAHPEVSSCSG